MCFWFQVSGVLLKYGAWQFRILVSVVGFGVEGLGVLEGFGIGVLGVPQSKVSNRVARSAIRQNARDIASDRFDVSCHVSCHVSCDVYVCIMSCICLMYRVMYHVMYHPIRSDAFAFRISVKRQLNESF